MPPHSEPGSSPSAQTPACSDKCYPAASADANAVDAGSAATPFSGPSELNGFAHPMNIPVTETDASVTETNVSVMETEGSVMETEGSVMETNVSVMETNVFVMETDVSITETDVSVMETDVSVMEPDLYPAKLRDASPASDHSRPTRHYGAGAGRGGGGFGQRHVVEEGQPLAGGLEAVNRRGGVGRARAERDRHRGVARGVGGGPFLGAVVVMWGWALPTASGRLIG